MVRPSAAGTNLTEALLERGRDVYFAIIELLAAIPLTIMRLPSILLETCAEGMCSVLKGSRETCRSL